MGFSGWEKLSLVDYDDNLTTTLFSSGCNFRCPFCHNKDLVLGKDLYEIPWEEIYSFLIKRKGMLNAVCVSGGEPTLLPDLEDKLKQIKELGYKVKLDSNGYNPSILKKLAKKGLVDYFAMDIKGSLDKYPEITGVAHLDTSRIKESIDFIMSSGIPYEFRTTVMEEYHDEEEMKKIGELIKGANRYFIQMYIDSPNCIKGGFHTIGKEKADILKEVIKPYVKYVSLRSYD